MSTLPATGLAAQAHDFAPDLLTIQESPPSAWPRGLMLGAGTLVIGLLAWACFARLDIVATAQGRLVPGSYTKLVQPAEPGVVTEILVKDGDRVRAGQLLLRLDERLASADVGALGREVALRRLSLRRAEAELADAPFIPAAGESPDLAAQVMAQYQARRAAYRDALAQEAEALNKARAELASAEQVLRKLQETVPLVRQSAQAYEKLRGDGFVGEVAANEKKREYLEREQDLHAQAATVQSLKSAVAQGERKVAAITSTYRSQLENERMEIRATLNRSAQDLDKSTIRSALLEIRAPTDGIVKDLAVTTRGAVVQAGALLMNIVPQGEALQAEVQLANEDAGFVAPGQAVRVKVAAYPFQKYGLLEGRVSHVAADASDPRQAQAAPSSALSNAAALPPPAYRALVSLDSQSLKGPDGEALSLSPGMLVAAEIHQGDRTVLEYLLSPVKKVRAEAARER